MRANLLTLLKPAGMAGIAALCLGLPALGTEPSTRPSDAAGQAPPSAPRLKPGDVLTVTVGQARLMLGDQVLAGVPHGQRVVVAEAGDAWVGTYVSLNGRQLAGWIRLDSFLPPACPAAPVSLATAVASPQPYVAYRPIEAEPAATIGLSPAYAGPYSLASEPASRDEFLVGRYDRHETDPNMHVWEPWRQ